MVGLELLDVSNYASSGDVSLNTLWPILAVMFGGGAGVFTFLVKHIGDLRGENRELRNKVMEDVIPALVQNTDASKALVEATTRFQQTMAVFEDREDRDRRGSRKGT